MTPRVKDHKHDIPSSENYERERPSKFLGSAISQKKASGPKADQAAQSTIRSLYSKSFQTVTVSKLGAVYMAQKRAQIRPKGVKSLIVQ